MRVEIRASGGDTCALCGSFAIVTAEGRSIAGDLAPLMEREMVRRELVLARALEEHAAREAAEYVDRIAALTRRFADVQEWTVEVIATTLEATKEQPSWWRLVRRRRERKYAERLDGALAEFVPLAAVEVA